MATIRNIGTVDARIYQLINYTTGDGIWTILSIQGGETITLDLRNSAKTLTSDLRGNLLGVIMPGSNLTTWRLMPGTNSVSFFALSGTIETTFVWRPRAWSSDPRL